MTVSTSIVWPVLIKRPRAPMRATVARLIFEHAVAGIPVRVTYPDGRVLGGGSPGSPQFEVVRPAAFFARLGQKNSQEFGLFGRETVVHTKSTGEQTHPLKREVVKPHPLGGPVMEDEFDRRRPLAEWVVSAIRTLRQRTSMSGW